MLYNYFNTINLPLFLKYDTGAYKFINLTIKRLKPTKYFAMDDERIDLHEEYDD